MLLCSGRLEPLGLVETGPQVLQVFCDRDTEVTPSPGKGDATLHWTLLAFGVSSSARAALVSRGATRSEYWSKQWYSVCVAGKLSPSQSFWKEAFQKLF